MMDGEVTQSKRRCFYAPRPAVIGTAWIHPPPLEVDSACPCEELLLNCRLKKGIKKGDIDMAEQTELQQAGPHVQVPIWVPISAQVPVWSYRPHRGPIRGPRNFTDIGGF